MTAYPSVHDKVTCMLSAKKPGSDPCPMLVIEYDFSTYYERKHGAADSGFLAVSPHVTLTP